MPRISVPDLKKVVKKINAYFGSLNEIYVGRERTIELAKLALLTKQHILLFSDPGTAKTALASSLFKGITSSKNFEVQITSFMAEDALFGPYNMKKMRDEGILEHNIENMLPEAHFANLDEFLDGNPALLRSMLSSLNERQVIKGRQILDLPLHLAFCSTNVDPHVFMRRNPQAWAIFDRISFLGSMKYLETADDITEMVQRFQYRHDTTPKMTIDLAEINSVCDYIIFPPTLITDKLILMKYGEAVVEYRQKRKEKMEEIERESEANSQGNEYHPDYKGIIFHEISDRRICWASQMMELNAVLSGRIEVKPEDMFACHYMLGTSEIESQIWKEIVERKVQEIETMKRNSLSELQRRTLDTMADQFNALLRETDLDTKSNGIATMITQLQTLKPENSNIQQLYDNLKDKVEKQRQEVADEVLESRGLGSKSSIHAN